MARRNRTVVSWVLRIVIGSAFVAAGCLKVLDPAAFQFDVEAYQIVGHSTAFWIAHYLPFIEVALGVGLILGYQIKWTALLQCLLLFSFIAALAWSWKMGINIHCGCFGEIDFVRDQPGAILRDLIMILGLIYIANNQPKITPMH